MKKSIILILSILAILLAGGWFYWQYNKKAIIKDMIKNAISKGTDSLYYIHYDSSAIDEMNGNASFYKVALQSDSLESDLATFDSASAATIYNVHIDEVTVQGADIPSLLNNSKVEAKSIEIIRPVLQIILSGKKKSNALTRSDSLKIYEKLLGKFKRIHAGEIILTDGNIKISTAKEPGNTVLNGISVRLNDFMIDSSKNYSNIISYFVKAMVAKVTDVTIRSDKSRFVFSGVEYNAPAKLIAIRQFQQSDEQQQVLFEINQTAITGISTDAFIFRHQLNAGSLTCDGGLITIYLNSTQDNKDRSIEMDNNFFDEARLENVEIGHTKIHISDRKKPGKPPLVLTNVVFSAKDIQQLNAGTTIRNLISKSNWALSADGFSWMSDDKLYKMNVGPFKVNMADASVYVSTFSMIPQLSESAFAKRLSVQKDLYNIVVKDIRLKGINTGLLIGEQRLEAKAADMKPVMYIFNDRTVRPNPASRVGKYPHQQLQEIGFPFSIQQVRIQNGWLAYKEKGALSEQTGTVFFNAINGTISNLTNMKERIRRNPHLTLDVSTGFMGVSKVHTVWDLPLNTTNGAFKIKGTAGAFNATALNPVTEPLGMASLTQGKINKLEFNLTGNDHKTTGTTTLLYDDIRIELLKKDSTGLVRKGLMSVRANIVLKNNNPQNGKTRTADIDYARDTTRSFFNLLWKGIYSGVKKISQ